MAHELRLFWRRGKMRPKSGLILIGLMLGGWLLLSFFMFQKIGPLIPPPPFLSGAGRWAGAGGDRHCDRLHRVGDDVGRDPRCGGCDLHAQRSRPVAVLAGVAVARAGGAVVAPSRWARLPLYAGLLGPPLIWMAVFSSPLWLSAIVVLATLAFAATGLALLIVTGLFRLIGPRNTRVLAQIISAVAGAAVFLSFQYFNISSRGAGSMGEQEMAAMIANLNLDPQAWWMFPARAFTGDIPSTLLWLLAVALLFPLGVYVFSRSFVADAAAASAMGQKKRVADVRVANVHGGVMQSVVRKEFRLLARDPLLLSQIGLQLIYFIPLAFILIRPDRGISLTEAAFAPALTLLAGTLAGSLTWITVSAEDAPDLLASAPVSAKMVDRAKFTAAVAPVLMLMAIPVVILLARDAWAGAWTAGGVIASAISAALIGLWRRAPGSRREFVRRRSKGTLMAGLGQAMVAMGITATAGLGAYGLPWLAILPAIVAAAMLGALYKPTPSTASAV